MSRCGGWPPRCTSRAAPSPHGSRPAASRRTPGSRSSRSSPTSSAWAWMDARPSRHGSRPAPRRFHESRPEGGRRVGPVRVGDGTHDHPVPRRVPRMDHLGLAPRQPGTDAARRRDATRRRTGGQAMSKGKDVLLGHADEADGIDEYDNPLPDWWLGMFYLTIIWGIGYG